MASAANELSEGMRLDRDGGEMLRQLRWSKGISLDHCALALDVEVPEMLAKERGRAFFSVDELALLAGLLDLTPDLLTVMLQTPMAMPEQAPAKPRLRRKRAG